MDAAGNLYGTTQAGGAYNEGTVFQVSAVGRTKVLHSFGGYPDGVQPYAGVIRDQSGDLYGTTGFGGNYGYGTVFKLSKSGHESVLYSFSGLSGDPAWPVAALVMDRVGSLYGTSMEGGSTSFGTVFKVDSTRKLTVLHSFTGMGDGAFPAAPLIRDTAANLYGTTTNPGEVFEITP